MKRFSINGRHLLGAVLALAVSSAASVRADYAYAFASQTITNVALTPAGGTITLTSPVGTGTSDSATLAGFSGAANTDPTDAIQSYVGTPPPAPQNDFNKWATFASGSPLAAGLQPTGPGPFSRGDVAILGSNAAANVAESYTTQGTGSGSGSFSAAFSFTATAGTVLTLSYNFANDLYTSIGGNGNAQAGFKFDVTIKDSAGTVVFDSSPSQTNVSASSPPNSPESINSGAVTATTAALAAGTTYTMTFSGSENTFVTANSVPEPSSLLMGGLAVGLLGGVCGWRNRKARLQA